MEQKSIKVFTHFNEDTGTHCYNLFRLVTEIPKMINDEKIMQIKLIVPSEHNQQDINIYNYYKLFSENYIYYIAIKKEVNK